jgi:DNA-binding LacI/PurR family transcriptional regulator
VDVIERSGAKVVTSLESDPDSDPDSDSDSDSDRDEPLGYSRGPELQVRHLVERGHRRLAFAGTADPRLSGLADQRAALAMATAADAGVEFEVARPAPAADAARDWIERGVTGIVAYNDDIAASIVGAARRQGLDVPGALAVVGHDDAPIAKLMVPSLTTVHVDTAGLGRYFAALALHAATGSPGPTAGPETRATLVVRESA